MNIFEQAAAFLDDEILLEGELKSKYSSVSNRTDKFFDILERPATKILDLKSDRHREATNIDVIRRQMFELKREYDRTPACQSNRFINGFMQVMDIIMDNLEDGDTDYIYAAKWPQLMNWIKDNAQRIEGNYTNEAIIAKLAGEYITKVARPALQKFKTVEGKKQRKSARVNVKTMLDNPEFQQVLINRSEGRFDLRKNEGSRPPVIIDNVKHLTLNFRNYEELNEILAAKDENELYNVVKNQFDSPSGIYHGITDTTIPEGIEFQYQNDALAACDWGLKDKVVERILRRGTYYNSDKSKVILFVNNGESLRSEFDVGEEESRYVNEFASHNNELYIALNRNDRFNKLYTNQDVKFDVFEIVQGENSQVYISRGTYILDTIDDERIKYVREKETIERDGTGASETVAESVMSLAANLLID